MSAKTKKEKIVEPTAPTEDEKRMLDDIFSTSMIRAAHPTIFYNVKAAVDRLLRHLGRADLATLLEPM